MVQLNDEQEERDRNLSLAYFTRNQETDDDAVESGPPPPGRFWPVSFSVIADDSFVL